MLYNLVLQQILHKLIFVDCDTMRFITIQSIQIAPFFTNWFINSKEKTLLKSAKGFSQIEGSFILWPRAALKSKRRWYSRLLYDISRFIVFYVPISFSNTKTSTQQNSTTATLFCHTRPRIMFAARHAQALFDTAEYLPIYFYHCQ
jgi:hypothetical protein